MTTTSLQALDKNGKPALEIRFVVDYDLAWNDAKSGANQNFSCWRPKPPSGFYALGHYAKREHGQPETPMFVAKPIQSDALKKPVDYDLVWGDWGSGAKMDGSFWKPKAPTGYKALGLVAGNGYGKPALEAVMCVRNDLVFQAQVGDQIWGDWGSGAKGNVTFWQIKPLSAPPDSKLTYITPGSFCGHNSYNALTSSDVAQALAVQLPADESGKKPQLPKLTSSIAPAEDIVWVRDSHNNPIPFSVAYLPCTMVQDEAFRGNIRGQVNETPFYRLEKYAVYRKAQFNNNTGGKNGRMGFEYSVGMSKTETETMTHTVGVSMTVGYDGAVVKAGPSVSMTVSYSFGLEKSTARTMSQEIKKSVQYDVPANGAGCLYTVSYVYKLKRANGEEVNSWTANSDDTYYAAFPESA